MRIVDQNGQPAVSGAPSATSTIFDVQVGPGFAFSPDTVNISVGDTVRWTWASSGHSVTSGQPCQADSQFCSPDDMNCFPGVVSNSGTVYRAYLRHRWHLFIFLPRPLPAWYDWRGQCLGRLRALGMVGRSGLAERRHSPCRRLFPANGKFYGMGGRSSDAAGSDFTHPFEYDPDSNSWTTKSATYPGQPGQQYGLLCDGRIRNALHLLRRRLGSRSRRQLLRACFATIRLPTRLKPSRCRQLAGRCSGTILPWRVHGG